MSNFRRAALSAAISACAVVSVGAVATDSAMGAPLFVEAIAVAPPIVVVPAPIDEAIAETPIADIVPASLSDLVRRHADANVSDSELKCLATAVYFESKSEPLAGQLAVARVVMNRAESGRFAKTLCGVVKQPSQFSFVRGGGFPPVRNQLQWRNAVGVAHVAMKGLHESAAPGALFFHAKRVSPNWGKRRLASVGNHIFYR